MSAKADSVPRVVVVTGAFGCLGVTVARSFAKLGDQVALVDRVAAPKSLQDEFAAGHLALGGIDLAALAPARAAIDEVRRRLGPPDVLVNVAGGFRWQSCADGDLEGWDEMYAANLRTAVIACKVVLEYMVERKTGHIVNVGAAAAQRATAGMGAYAASKSGVLRLTESLAEELKDEGIAVNAVMPSIIDTPANRAAMPKADFTRWVSPESVAEVIAFLASEAARGVRGAAVPVVGLR